MNQHNGEHVLNEMDTYIDAELTSQEQASVAAHLSGCDACAQELETRRAIRGRLRTAVRGAAATPGLDAAIRQSVRQNRPPAKSPFFYNAALPIAAALMVCCGGGMAYERGYLRLTDASQEAYVASVSSPLPSILRVGLGDHVHCAVYKAFPDQHPTFEQMAQDLGEYKALAPLLAKQIPAGYRVKTAHQCSYHERSFVHLTLRNGSILVSLAISRKGEGESFEKNQLIPALTESGIAIYQTAAQRFEVAGFETPGYLVYVVSNLNRQDNLGMMATLAPSVRSFLQSVPG